MIVLDTNVLSTLMQNRPNETVVEWLNKQLPSSIWTTAITVFEIRFGLAAMYQGSKQAQLEADFERIMSIVIGNRIAPFDEVAAGETAALAVRRRREGRPHELRDSMIAGIAIAHRATLATRNTRHFADLPVPVVDPWVA